MLPETPDKHWKLSGLQYEMCTFESILENTFKSHNAVVPPEFIPNLISIRRTNDDFNHVMNLLLCMEQECDDSVELPCDNVEAFFASGNNRETQMVTANMLPSDEASMTAMGVPSNAKTVRGHRDKTRNLSGSQSRVMADEGALMEGHQMKRPGIKNCTCTTRPNSRKSSSRYNTRNTNKASHNTAVRNSKVVVQMNELPDSEGLVSFISTQNFQNIQDQD